MFKRKIFRHFPRVRTSAENTIVGSTFYLLSLEAVLQKQKSFRSNHFSSQISDLGGAAAARVGVAAGRAGPVPDDELVDLGLLLDGLLVLEHFLRRFLFRPLVVGLGVQVEDFDVDRLKSVKTKGSAPFFSESKIHVLSPFRKNQDKYLHHFAKKEILLD
jgi:hypothetical protein